jgi:HicB_like antitoxin of bacterial toxin-antitoxin system
VDVPTGTLKNIYRQTQIPPKGVMKAMRYTVLIEKGPTSYGAYVPDLPGCVVVAETRDEVERLIREAPSGFISKASACMASPFRNQSLLQIVWRSRHEALDERHRSIHHPR